MLVVLSFKALGCKDFWKPFKPCHVGIYGIALTAFSQMSAMWQGFNHFLKFFALLYIGQIIHHQHKGEPFHCWGTFEWGTRQQTHTPKILLTLLFWYLFESSWWVLSDEYQYLKCLRIFKLLYIVLFWIKLQKGFLYCIWSRHMVKQLGKYFSYTNYI